MSASKDKKVRQIIRRAQHEKNAKLTKDLTVLVRNKPRYVPMKLWKKALSWTFRVQIEGNEDPIKVKF